mmetsp:Transcript_45102/g.67973  ORF Transcript_45102/g.67973 Transcript_45102/m.67973 type:complete len:132 (-) Transcript_45102:34-429(-)
MGCTHSADATEPDMDGRKGVGHTERMGRNSRSKGIGASERLPRNSASKSSIPDDQNETLPELDKDGNLMPEEVSKRITDSAKTMKIVIGDTDDKENEQDLIRVQYAYLTQRGYYPDGEFIVLLAGLCVYTR